MIPKIMLLCAFLFSISGTYIYMKCKSLIQRLIGLLLIVAACFCSATAGKWELRDNRPLYDLVIVLSLFGSLAGIWAGIIFMRDRNVTNHRYIGIALIALGLCVTIICIYYMKLGPK